MPTSCLSRFFSAMFIVLIAISAVYAQPNRDAYDFFETEYQWIEIEDVGIPLDGLRDNEFMGTFPIGYPFPFYGEIYEHIWVSSNGFIGFGPTIEYASFDNQELPNEDTPNNIIAAYWTDLNPGAVWADGLVLVGERDGLCVIQFDGVGEHNPEGRSPDNTISMQIILEPDGDIILQYRDIGRNFDIEHGTIGVDGSEGMQGTTLRHNGEGVELAAGSAFLLSEHGPGDFLIWDGASVSPSGDAQEQALRSLGHDVAHLRLTAGQQLPDADALGEYEAVFVNLGNYGVDGRDAHVLTDAEGRILADYLAAGNAVYMEGGDTWSRDPARAVHPFFHIEGINDGGQLDPPVFGVAGTLGQGLDFEDYQAENNEFVDYLEILDGAEVCFTFEHDGDPYNGMISFRGEDYRTVGCSFEFGGLVDGNDGTQEELMINIIDFFRSPPPEFPPPLNLRASVGDGEVTLTWDHPRRAQRLMNVEILDMRREIARLSQPRDGEKPSGRDRARVRELTNRIAELEAIELPEPQRDDLLGFNIYVDAELYDMTNAHEYTVFDLENNQQYTFTVSALYVNPDGESESVEPIQATPTGSVTVGWSEGFEQFNGGLNSSPVIDGWEWGRPAMGAANGENAWGTNLLDPYVEGADIYLYLPPIDLEAFDPEQDRVQFSFNHFMDAEDLWDGGNVQVSLDNGERWDVLIPVDGYPAADIFALNVEPGFTGTMEDWENVRIDLSPFAGETALLRFRFASDESNFRRYMGWYVDDMLLEQPVTGSLRISVLDDISEEPIGDALVTLVGFGEGLTFPEGHNQYGQIRFLDVPIGDYQVTASKPGFIDDGLDVSIIEGNETFEEIFLVRWDSELEVAPDELIDEDIAYGEQVDYQVTLANTGTSATNFSIYTDFFVGLGQNFNVEESGILDNPPNRDEPWELIRTYDLTAETGEQFFLGANFIRDEEPMTYKLIAGAGDFQSGDCRFYTFNRDGSFERYYAQNDFRIVDWGLRDLTYNPVEDRLYGSNSNRIFRMNPQTGGQAGSFTGAPLEVNRAIAYIPEEDAFWVGDWDDTWYKVDDVGNILDQNSNHGLTGVTGMAWNPSDPDGAYLYVHCQESENGGAALYRYNPATREIVRQLVTAEENEGYAGGAFVTYLYDTHSYVLGVVIQGHGDSGDAVKLYNLFPRETWISVSPVSGELEAESQIDLTVTFNAESAYDTSMSAVLWVVDELAQTSSPILCEVLVQGGGAGLAGQIVLDGGEGNIRNAYITLNGQGRIRPDAEGLFEYPRLAPGIYQIQVSLNGYDLFESDPYDLQPDSREEVEIHLSPLQMGTIAGNVVSVYVDDQEQPIPLEGVEISILNAEGETELTSTDVDGNFEQELLIGEYTVSAFLADWGRQVVNNVEVLNGEITDVNFVLDDRFGIEAMRVNGNYDDHIELMWLPPGSGGEDEVFKHHDGILANGVYLQTEEDILAVRFEPEGVYDVLQMITYTIHEDDPIGNGDGWPDYYTDNIILYIFTEDPETGLPGELIYQRTLTDRLRNNDVGYDTLMVINNQARFMEGAFYLGWSQDPDERHYDAVGLDAERNAPCYARFDNGWRQYNQMPGDLMMEAVVWNHVSQQVERLGNAQREVRQVVAEVSDEIMADVHLANLPITPIRIPDPPYNWKAIYGMMIPPNRDLRLGFQVFIDGDPAFEDMLENGVYSWSHQVDSENEDHEYTYTVNSFYLDEDEPLPGVEVVGRANNSPESVLNFNAIPDGLEFTVTWQPPLFNEDESWCEDYAGVDIYLNGELGTHIDDPDIDSWTSAIPEGGDGWYEISVVAFDEVPNYSIAVSGLYPLGVAEVHSFESNFDRSFVADPPATGWRRSTQINHGPGSAHTGAAAWATAPSVGNYENNAEWLITTNYEYFVEAETAQLEFYHFIEAENGKDGGQVQISVNDGDWEVIEPVDGYPDQTVFALDNTPGFTGLTPGWVLTSFDLSPYTGNRTKFRWVFSSDNSIRNYAGWYIDDLVFWGCRMPEYGTVQGIVVNQFGEAVNTVNVSDGIATVRTNVRGEYILPDVLPGENTITFTKAGYATVSLNRDYEPDFAADEQVVLARVQLVADPVEYDFQLNNQDRFSTSIHLQNTTPVEVPYNIRLVSDPVGLNWQGDLQNAQFGDISDATPHRDDPWDVHFDYDLTEITGRHRIMGVEYADDQFYVVSADRQFGAAISVIDWEGRVRRTYNQPVDVLGWGLRDLAFDGETLYGSQNRRIYGFDLAGRAVSEQAGAPITVNRALAFDASSNSFWTAEWDSPWYLVDRGGNVISAWAEHGLTGVYGFAVYDADPDGMFLYVLNLEDENTTGIYRANPIDGEIEPVAEFEGAPTGCFVTGAWDADFWLLGAVIGDVNGSQHLVGLELGRREGWINIDPVSGVLQPNEIEELTLSVDIPENAARNDRFTGSINIHSFNDIVTEISFTARIIDGFEYFDDPPDGQDFHRITIESATLEDLDLSIASEIAVLMPDGEVGGVMRWFGAPGVLSAVISDDGFEQGESFSFRIWEKGMDEEFTPVVTYIDGPRVCQIDGETRVGLFIDLPEVQEVTLAEGWNLVSIFVQPENLMVSDILSDVNDRGNLIIAKDGYGRFWWPAQNFDGLGNWNVLGGYMIAVSADEMFTVIGEQLPSDTPIPLLRGWNTVAYLLEEEVDSRVAFAGILGSIIIAKNGEGDFMVPRYDYYGMGNLIPGRGYKVKVTEDVELIYQNGQDVGNVGLAYNAQKSPSTGSDMSMLITDIIGLSSQDGDYIVARSAASGVVVGTAQLASFPCGLIIRGDDPNTVKIDGATENDEIVFEVQHQGKETQLQSVKGVVTYTSDDFVVDDLRYVEQALPKKFEVKAAYPNPFNAVTMVRIGLKDHSDVTIQMRDLTGRLAWETHLSNLSAGWHDVSINGGSLPSGVYLLSTAAEGNKSIQKLVLLK